MKMVNSKLIKLTEKFSDELFRYIIEEDDKKLKDLEKEVEQRIQDLEKSKDHSNYLLLPENKEHPELLFSLNRLSYNVEVELAAKKLEFKLKNSQGYIVGINFDQAEKISNSLNGFMNTPSLLAEALKIMKSGEGYDGLGNKLQSTKLKEAFKEITEVKLSWRAEWLGHNYSRKDGEMQVTYTKFVNGKLTKVTEPLDQKTLMKDKNINLEDWINNPTSQGLPSNNVSDGSLRYWPPKKESVAWFDADASRAGLDCDWDPLGSVAGLGVRVVRKKNIK